MTQMVPLDRVPNQQLSILLEGHRYVFAVKEANGVMAVTVERDGVVLIRNVRAVAGFPIIPYRYLAREFGNFIFTNTTAGEIPYYLDFGVTCWLVYSSAAEIDAAYAAA